MKMVLLLLSLLFVYELGVAQQPINEKIYAIPYELKVYNSPVGYWVSGDAVKITSKAKTNLFNAPNGTSKISNAPMILFEPSGDFTLSAKVSGELRAVYDVAALVVYDNEDTWAKFCYENSVEKEPTMVSVVTRHFSDDSNSVPAQDYAYMAVVKKSDEYSFFYSADGLKWKMIRHFNLQTSDKIKVGFAAHGSRGGGFTGIFSEIKYQDGALEDMRDLH